MNINRNEIKNRFNTVTHYFDQPLSKYTYTKVGGPSDVLFLPKTVEELIAIKKYAIEQNIPLIVLGNASNLIVRDGGIRGFVVLLSEMDGFEVRDTKLVACAGAKLIEIAAVARDASLTGLEFAAGIPGSIGGAVYMNAGAYGGEIADVFESCQVLTADGSVETWDKAQLNFAYRKSALQDGQVICLLATFSLQKGNQAQISAEMERLNSERQLKQPLEYPSCGSVFKRPDGYFTGKLIQDAGLQGKIWGGAQISEKHAGFIINRGGATAKDYEELIAFIIETIQEKFKVTLQTEVRIIGEARD